MAIREQRTAGEMFRARLRPLRERQRETGWRQYIEEENQKNHIKERNTKEERLT